MMTVRHPWSKWLAHKKPFKLVQGVDFDGAIHSMSVQFRRAAEKYKKIVSVCIEGNELHIVIKGDVVNVSNTESLE